MLLIGFAGIAAPPSVNVLWDVTYLIVERVPTSSKDILNILVEGVVQGRKQISTTGWF
jgi:hypothetical protein